MVKPGDGYSDQIHNQARGSQICFISNSKKAIMYAILCIGDLYMLLSNVHKTTFFPTCIFRPARSNF